MIHFRFRLAKMSHRVDIENFEDPLKIYRCFYTDKGLYLLEFFWELFHRYYTYNLCDIRLLELLIPMV